MSFFKKEAIINCFFLFVFLGILPILTYWIYVGVLNPHKDYTITKSQLFFLKAMVIDFEKDVGRYPSNDEKLEVLLYDKKIKGWKGPYINYSLLTDYWGKNIIYGNANEIYYIGSTGKNMKLETSLNNIKEKKHLGDDIFIFFIQSRKQKDSQ